MAQKPRGMHPEDIKAFICKTWGTLAAFSVAKGRAPAAASNAIRQPSYSHPMAQIIAKEMGKQPYDVWPDFYHPDGTPVPCRIGRTSTAASGAAHRQNEVAA